MRSRLRLLNDAAGCQCSTLRTTQFKAWRRLEATRQIDTSVEFCWRRVQVPDLELLANMFPSTKGRLARRLVPARKRAPVASTCSVLHLRAANSPKSDIGTYQLGPYLAGAGTVWSRFTRRFVSEYWPSREHCWVCSFGIVLTSHKTSLQISRAVTSCYKQEFKLPGDTRRYVPAHSLGCSALTRLSDREGYGICAATRTWSSMPELLRPQASAVGSRSFSTLCRCTSSSWLLTIRLQHSREMRLFSTSIAPSTASPPCPVRPCVTCSLFLVSRFLKKATGQ